MSHGSDTDMNLRDHQKLQISIVQKRRTMLRRKLLVCASASIFLISAAADAEQYEIHEAISEVDNVIDANPGAPFIPSLAQLFYRKMFERMPPQLLFLMALRVENDPANPHLWLAMMRTQIVGEPSDVAALKERMKRYDAFLNQLAGRPELAKANAELSNYAHNGALDDIGFLESVSGPHPAYPELASLMTQFERFWYPMRKSRPSSPPVRK